MEKAMNISYPIGNKLYLNITNRCPCSCTFCIRNNGDGAYGSDPLWLEHEPSYDEIMDNISKRDINSYDEIVFCGYGEPTSRIDVMLSCIESLRKRSCPPLRLNTNGLSDLINERQTAAELCNAFDTISISLNAPTEDEYMSVTRPKYKNAFESMKKFTSDCTSIGTAKIVMTVVDVIPPEQIKASEKLAESLGAELRIRTYQA